MQSYSSPKVAWTHAATLSFVGCAGLALLVGMLWIVTFCVPSRPLVSTLTRPEAFSLTRRTRGLQWNGQFIRYIDIQTTTRSENPCRLDYQAAMFSRHPDLWIPPASGTVWNSFFTCHWDVREHLIAEMEGDRGYGRYREVSFSPPKVFCLSFSIATAIGLYLRWVQLKGRGQLRDN
jgi:hypothetical protein